MVNSYISKRQNTAPRFHLYCISLFIPNHFIRFHRVTKCVTMRNSLFYMPTVRGILEQLLIITLQTNQSGIYASAFGAGNSMNVLHSGHNFGAIYLISQSTDYITIYDLCKLYCHNCECTLCWRSKTICLLLNILDRFYF